MLSYYVTPENDDNPKDVKELEYDRAKFQYRVKQSGNDPGKTVLIVFEPAYATQGREETQNLDNPLAGKSPYTIVIPPPLLKKNQDGEPALLTKTVCSEDRELIPTEDILPINWNQNIKGSFDEYEDKSSDSVDEDMLP